MGDKWIPNYPTNSIIHSAKGDESNALVLNLINHDLHLWRTNWIMEMFDKEDAEAIFQISLSRRYVDDPIICCLLRSVCSLSNLHIRWLGS